MKTSVKQCLLAVLAGAFFALAGCQNILNSPPDSSLLNRGGGNVAITAGGSEAAEAARTLAPSTGGFVHELTFSGPGSHGAETFTPAWPKR